MQFNVIKTVIAVYPGRFQPFSKHHAAAFKFLQQKFGPIDTFIATSDVVKPPKSPLNFQEKKQIIDMYSYGDKLIQVKNPYKAEEITAKYDPKTTAIVFMVGDKDMKEDPRFAMKTKKDGTEGYFKPYKGNENNLKGYNKHGYLVVAPHQSYDIPGVGEMSGTNIRVALSADISPEKYKEMFKSIFGWYNEKIAKMLKQKFSQAAVTKTALFENIIKDLILEGYKNDIPEELISHWTNLEILHHSINESKGYKSSITLKELINSIKESEVNTKILLLCGGAGGHMAHPFDIDGVKTGLDLAKVFVKTGIYLKNNDAPVKIDGVNASIRLANIDGKKEFVMDRGSNKPLDVKGVTKDDLEDRFAIGHGMVKVGGVVLDIFNESFPKIKGELAQLGMLKNPNILFNIEYVEGTTNVQDYGKNFLAIHNLLEVKQVRPTKRSTSEISYSKEVLESLIKKLQPVASKYGFEVLSSIPAKATKTPNFSSELSKSYTVVYDKTRKETKSLQNWLKDAKIPREDKIKLKDGKIVGALSKQVFLAIKNGKPITEFIADPKDYKKAIDGFVTYLATVQLGDALLKSLNSPLGPVDQQEGVVIRDKSISNEPFKITGSFIVRGLESSFN